MSSSQLLPGYTYRGNRPRTTADLALWHAQSKPEPALDPDFPIVDPHHHIFGTVSDAQHYRIEDLTRDLSTCGHRILGTVWVEAYGYGWRQDDPPELRSAGEVETITGLIKSLPTQMTSSCRIGAGMVSQIDMLLGERVGRVLDVHLEASEGRLRGTRHHAAFDSGLVGSFVPSSRPGLLLSEHLQRGVRELGCRDLSFDALVYHTQLGDVAALADACPATRIVLDHVGQIIGAVEYAHRRQEIFETWREAVTELARRPNVYVKVGGMGMPMFGFELETGHAPPSSEVLAECWRPYVEVCLETFGTERCMFESNFPVDKQSCSYANLWNAFKRIAGPLSESERHSLFHRTATQFYRLPSLEATCTTAAPER